MGQWGWLFKANKQDEDKKGWSHFGLMMTRMVQ